MGLICTTDDSEFEPRRSYPWDALRETLTAELGPAYGRLLAEPVPRRGEGKTDWYTESARPAVAASALASDQQAALFAVLGDMRRRILAFADRLEAPDRKSPDKGLATELRNAMRVSDENRHVWCVDEKPVLVAWGLTLFGQKIGETSLFGRSMAPPPEVEEPTPELDRETPTATRAYKPIRRFPWAPLLWLVFVGLVGVSYFLLFQACGVLVAPENSWLRKYLPTACHAQAATDPLAPLHRQHDELQNLVRQAEIKVAMHEGECATPAQLPVRPRPDPPRAETPPPPRVACPPPSELDRRLHRQGATQGDMEISLKWEGKPDLDLHVFCPGGETNDRRNETACGGQFDVDMNVGTDPGPTVSLTPVEHIFWRTHPPPGRYQVQVELYDRNGDTRPVIPFEVYVKRNGRTETARGRASVKGQTYSAYAFDVEAEPSAAATADPPADPPGCIPTPR